MPGFSVGRTRAEPSENPKGPTAVGDKKWEHFEYQIIILDIMIKMMDFYFFPKSAS